MGGVDSLRNQKYLNLATFRKTGRAVSTPVWFAESQGKLYVFTAGDSGKVKRLRNSSRARVAPCDYRGRLLGDWSDAEARIVEDQETIAQAYAALRKKYGFQMWITDLFSRLAGRMGRRAILEIELNS
jgi:PPOX class probable F420-dependent enzyme